MDKIKILYFTQNWTNYVDKTKHLFKQTLNLRPDVEVYYIEKGGDISAILAELDFQPDFIYNDDFMLNRLKFGPIRGLNNIEIPSGVMFYDIRKMRNKFYRYVVHNRIDLTFACYRDRFLTKYPNLTDRFRWLPLFVDTKYFKDLEIERVNDFLLLGDITPKVYPIRFKILQTMLNEPGFVYHRHPGYRHFDDQEHGNLIIGENYVKELNKSKMFLTCGSRYNYVLGKYFEVPACNTLLLATGSKEHQDLGFIDGETFVEINENNFREKAAYYLKNEDERLAIAKKGNDMIRNKHSVEIRVDQFVNYIRDYLQKGLKI